jgi:hypothetical protein
MEVRCPTTVHSFAKPQSSQLSLSVTSEFGQLRLLATGTHSRFGYAAGDNTALLVYPHWRNV